MINGVSYQACGSTIVTGIDFSASTHGVLKRGNTKLTLDKALPAGWTREFTAHGRPPGYSSILWVGEVTSPESKTPKLALISGTVGAPKSVQISWHVVPDRSV